MSGPLHVAAPSATVSGADGTDRLRSVTTQGLAALPDPQAVHTRVPKPRAVLILTAFVAEGASPPLSTPGTSLGRGGSLTTASATSVAEVVMARSHHSSL